MKLQQCHLLPHEISACIKLTKNGQTKGINRISQKPFNCLESALLDKDIMYLFDPSISIDQEASTRSVISRISIKKVFQINQESILLGFLLDVFFEEVGESNINKFVKKRHQHLCILQAFHMPALSKKPLIKWFPKILIEAFAESKHFSQ